MAIDLQSFFDRGGKRLLNLLEYCVRSVQVDPVFLFLARDYRLAPNVAKAEALYDVFCRLQAPARVTAQQALPPCNLRIEQDMRRLRADRTASMAPLIPPRELFDSISGQLWENSAELRKIRRGYRVRRSPTENLPGGRMTEGQRFFVDRVWLPVVRPQLVGAGFWRVATVG